ncbi:MAG: zinc ribbon domain-containing protein [Candidatus Eremiobacteraeota bacterium]|nr:zinc ribbon domain-containing protein [Candidatus Eremiobacteraeota bacterium]
MGEEALFELTRAPQLNEVITLARAVYEGEGIEDDLKKSIKTLNTFRREMRSFFRHQLKFQENTPTLMTQAPLIEKALEKLRTGLEEAYRYFSSHDREALVKGIAIMRESFAELFASIDSLKEEERNIPRYAESPLQNELMRVGYGVMRGTIKPEAFKERLAAVRQSIKAFYEGFDKMSPAPHEEAFFHEKRSEIKKALKEYFRGLEEAALYFADHSTEHIARGLERSKEASEMLVLLHRGLTESGAGPRTRPCIQCGGENEVTAKFCVHCNARLADFATGQSSSMEFRMDQEGMVKASAHADTEFTRDLQNTVLRARDGSLSSEGFLAELSRLEAKVLHARKEKARLTLPGDLKGDSPESLVLEEVNSAMEEGIGELLSGIGRMKLFAQAGDESALIFGLEEALSGADRLFQVQFLSESMKKAQPS